MNGVVTVDLINMQNVDVRFIEYMPFDGNKWNFDKFVPYRKMLAAILAKWPQMERLEGDKHDTAKVCIYQHYQVLRNQNSLHDSSKMSKCLPMSPM